ncbi:MAG: (E)-4-hydroxy-3-methylbut-2-enyl-diphosphate synthase [Rikenellaceae bacterium]|nr:(E)-4-hydroxy-3-methylbut-2-enyl-diphosphate synthase [Rikenellaceae bacterium]
MEKYCEALNRYARAETIPVRVGRTAIGGQNPVRLQSMANTGTCDIEASVAQALRIAEAGGELVRFTAQGRIQAENLGRIKVRLLETGCDAPLVADIHFSPEAALIAARHVEKVRINPGNFVDKKRDGAEYSEEKFAAERDKVRQRLRELIAVCHEREVALSVGVNHGSLSARMVSRWGDTPRGMVESALEFLRICLDEGFDQVVVSMKSSNVRVMVQAYRLLAVAMRAEGMRFPLHLGVTEAGNGEDGRVKSAVGIGALLADGLGDTIRVSLTEAPENEISVARKLLDYFQKREHHAAIHPVNASFYHPFEYQRRQSTVNGIIGGGQPPVVVVSATGEQEFTTDAIPDFIAGSHEASGWMYLTLPRLTDKTVAALRRDETQVIVLETDNVNGVAEQRAFFLELEHLGLHNPVIVKRDYAETDLETLQIKAAADLGLLFLDGFGDGIWIDNRSISPRTIASLAFGILQAARVRISRTEYIACPGCGRTLFDLETTLARVKEVTLHLKGLKIGVMGCVVNGPGEMADADYGYVGAGPGRVTLYRGKEIVKANINEKDAIDELLKLIEATAK